MLVFKITSKPRKGPETNNREEMEMPEKVLRKHLLLTEKACNSLDELAKAAGMPKGQYISCLILEEAARQKDELSASGEAHRAYLAAHAADRKMAILLDSWNSYLHQFESGATDENFRPAADDPQIWVKKADDLEEYRRKVAYDKKRRKSP
ncbi:hypothetical protein DRA42_12775 [Ethanoligenens harbinense]|nr:hypothetical protein CXQ68_12730 [Ethanoligenens harbinense YUAN-3]AYF39661.1 hypothetical protein CXP51_12625 [Ethanoligenens harbinense]AYF42493.1 hypothetical protein CN246_13200 [Ethanoligenens harbinense]QCN93243.1 hypothetical protein DRA42_12775 [Ethanoligenens harbinense]